MVFHAVRTIYSDNWRQLALSVSISLLWFWRLNRLCTFSLFTTSVLYNNHVVWRKRKWWKLKYLLLKHELRIADHLGPDLVFDCALIARNSFFLYKYKSFHKSSKMSTIRTSIEISSFLCTSCVRKYTRLQKKMWH